MKFPNTITLISAIAGLSISIYLLYPIVKNHKIISESRKVVEMSLKDPASAQYKNEVPSKDKKTVCGEVNAKNSLGGYVGFKRYLTRGKQILIEGDTFQNWDLQGGDVKPTQNEIELLTYTEITPYVKEIDASRMRKDLFKWVWENSCKSA